MSVKAPTKGAVAWLTHRLVANYWSLPLAAVIASPLAAWLIIWLDREGVTRWLLAHDLAPVASAESAKDLATAIVGVNVALFAVFMSISLIVLTLAASSLGVRLIDRWLDKPLTRLSLAGLAFTLVFAVIILAATDADATLARTPLLGHAFNVGFLCINVAMIGVALHDLGRTTFVDTSIAEVGHDAWTVTTPVTQILPWEGAWETRVTASREGYVEGADMDRLERLLPDTVGRVRICAAPGQHVLAGETLLLIQNGHCDAEEMRGCIAIGDYRSSAQSTVFAIRLLVEIGARALSPAVNDFYTALACTDRLANAIEGQSAKWVDDGFVAAFADNPRFELPGQDFCGLFADPLSAFRQSASAYPTVTIRMIGNLTRVLQQCRHRVPGFRKFLLEEAGRFAAHALQECRFNYDRSAIARALEETNAVYAQQEASA